MTDTGDSTLTPPHTSSHYAPAHGVSYEWIARKFGETKNDKPHAPKPTTR
jgi:hypothetical protein